MERLCDIDHWIKVEDQVFLPLKLDELKQQMEICLLVIDQNERWEIIPVQVHWILYDAVCVILPTGMDLIILLKNPATTPLCVPVPKSMIHE